MGSTTHCSMPSKAVPALHGSTFVPSQSFWYRWRGMQIVATARLRTALIIAVRDYERDCITPRVHKSFGTPETVKPRIEGYVDAIKDIFPEIPGISCGSSFELEVRNVICRNVGRINEQTRDEQTRMDAYGLFMRAARIADGLVRNEVFTNPAGLIIYDWFSTEERKKRRESLGKTSVE